MDNAHKNVTYMRTIYGFLKNAMFYKTLNGSKVGDIFMSIIQTARLAKINVFEYLTCLQENADDVKINPERWLPWNYKEKKPTRKTA